MKSIANSLVQVVMTALLTACADPFAFDRAIVSNDVAKADRMISLSKGDINVCNGVIMAAIDNKTYPLEHFLNEPGGTPNCHDADKPEKTALMEAAYFGALDAVVLLLDKGADIDAYDDDGWTALDYAMLRSKTAVVSYLAQRGGHHGVSMDQILA